MDNAENVFTSGENIFDFLNDVVEHEHELVHTPDVKLVTVDEEDSDYNSEKGTRASLEQHSDRQITSFVELEVPMINQDKSHGTSLTKSFVRPKRIELVPQIKIPQRITKLGDVQIVPVQSAKSSDINGSARIHVQSSSSVSSFISERSIYEFAFVCQWCPHAFKHKSELDAHFIARHNQPYTCRTCTRVFRDQSTLLHHERVCGMSESSVSCNFCNKTFSSSEELDGHVDQVHKRSKISCSLCSNVFDSKQDLLSHMKWHHKPPISEDISGTLQKPILALVRKSSNGTSLVLKIGEYYYPTCKERYNHQHKECVQRCSNRSCKFRAKVKIIKDVSPECVEYFNIENFEVVEKSDAQPHTCTPLNQTEYLKITKNEQIPLRGVKRKTPRFGLLPNNGKKVKEKNDKLSSKRLSILSDTPDRMISPVLCFTDEKKEHFDKEELCDVSTMDSDGIRMDSCAYNTRIPCANRECKRLACDVSHSFVFCKKCKMHCGQTDIDRTCSTKSDYCSDWTDGFCKNRCETQCMNAACKQLICVKHSTKVCQSCVDISKGTT